MYKGLQTSVFALGSGTLLQAQFAELAKLEQPVKTKLRGLGYGG